MAAYVRRTGFRRFGALHAPASELRPVFAAGSALLALGVLLVVAGGVLFQGQSASLSLWIVLVALFLLLSTMAVNVGRTPVAPAPSIRRPTAVADRRHAIPMLHPEPRSDRVPLRAPSMEETGSTEAAQSATSTSGPGIDLETRTTADLGTSIPGTYLTAIAHPRADAARWEEIAPPLAAGLPFSVGLGRSSDEPDDRSAPVLALELARLQARVRELEARRPPALSGGSRSMPVLRPRPPANAPEPPSPPMLSVAPAGRGCVGCGTALGSGAAALLCWGCGRSVCSGCYWRFGPGPGLHRCPECLTRSPMSSTSISGGRSTPIPTVGAGVAGTGRPTSSPAGR